VCQCFNRCREHPCQLRLHLAPPPRDGSAFGPLRRSAQTHHMSRDDLRLGRMTAPMIHEHHVQRRLRGVRQLMPQALNVDGGPRRSLQHKALPRGWFDGAIHIDVLELVRHWSHRCDTAQGHASALHRPQANTTFILTKAPHRGGSGWVRQRLDRSAGGLPPGGKTLLKCGHCFSVFLEAISGVPSIRPARETGPTCAPFYRPWKGHSRAAAMARGPSTWHSPQGGPSADAALPGSLGRRGAPCRAP
jgi:hypothetical protein